MRASKQFGRTIRESPAEADVPSHQLLLRPWLRAAIERGAQAAAELVAEAP